MAKNLRQERINGYARAKGPGGEASDQKNLDYWADRATKNSEVAPRASNGAMKLPSTGKRVDVRDTTMSPKASRNVDARMAAKDDLNHEEEGSSYMRGIRRNA